MKAKAIIGIIFVVASLLKLASIWGIVHIRWFERAAEEPWAVYFAPLLLIYVGLNLMVEGFCYDRDHWLERPLPLGDDGKRMVCSVGFGGDEYVFRGEPFHGARLETFCGGIRMDLRNAAITEDEEIDIRTLFGGVELIVPTTVNVIVKSRSLIGGVGNRTVRSNDPKAPYLHITASNFFGGVSIKN